MTAHHRMSPAEWGALILLSLLWGGSFFFAKVAVSTLPPLTVVLTRVGLAALALGLLLRLRGVALPRGAVIWGAFFGMGLLNNLIPFTLLFWGQTVIASGLAAILNATTPVFTLLVAHALTRDERLSAHRVAGVALGLVGVGLLVGMEALTGSGGQLPAILACLGAALSYGFAGVFGRRFRRMGIEPTVGAFGQVTASTAMMLPLVLAIDRPWQLEVPGPAVWGALIGLALLSTAMAYVLFFRLLATAGATNTVLVTLLVPVSAVLLGEVVLGESVAPPQLGGMALIGAGLLVMDGRVLGRRRPDSR